MAVAVTVADTAQTRVLVLDHVRIIDGTGAPPIENGRIVIEGDRIARVGPAAAIAAPGRRRDGRSRRTDRHAGPHRSPLPHRERPEAGAAAAQSRRHRVPRSRPVGREVRRAAPDDRGRRTARAADLHDRAAHRRRASRRIRPTPSSRAIAEEARRHAELSVRRGATALKIYFRLPFASAKAVIDVCEARRIPCTAHLELLDARRADRGRTPRHRAHHVVRREPAAARSRRRRTGRRCSRTTTRGATDAIACSPAPISTGREAQALYAVLRERKPLLDPTLAVFERRAAGAAAGASGRKPERDAGAGRRLREDEAADAPRGARRRARRRRRPHRGAVCRHAARRPGARWSCWSRAASRRSRRSPPRPAPPRPSSIAATSSARCVPVSAPTSSSSAAIPTATSRRSARSSG